MIAKVAGGYRSESESGRPKSRARRAKSRRVPASEDTLNVLRENVPMMAVPARKKAREKASRYLHLLRGRSSSYTQRFAKAGSPTTCGNSKNEGKFTPGNVCATGRSPEELNDEASERAQRWVETPAGKAAIAASKVHLDDTNIGPFGGVFRSVGVPASAEEVERIAQIYYAVLRESKKAAHGDPNLAKAISGIDVAVLRWLGGHVDSLGPVGKVIGKVPMGALAYLLQSDSPSLETAKKARIAVKETMKRIKSKEDDPAKFRRIKYTDVEDMHKAARHIKRYGDYYFALLLAALERSFGDLKVSVRIADHAYQGDSLESRRPVSRHTRRSPGESVKGERIKAGSAGDCGHRPVTGHFDSKNTCAVIHGRLRAREEAAGIEAPRADAGGATPSLGGKVGFVKAAYGRVQALFGKVGPGDRGLLRRAADALKGAYRKLRKGKDAGREMRAAAEVLKIEEKRASRFAKSRKPTDAAVLAGKLYLSKSGWGLMKVPNALVRGLFDAIHEPGVILPPSDSHLPRSKWSFNAHVSVLRPDEVEAAGGPGTITEWGHHFHYQIGPIKKVEPEGWDGMKEVYFVDVESPELEEMRAKYGLSRIPNKGKFRFHISVAVKPKSRGAGKARFAKADDCGHDPTGEFSLENECAARVAHAEKELARAEKRGASAAKLDGLRRNLEYFKAKAGSASPIRRETFASDVEDAAKLVDPARIRGTATAKVWVADLYDAFRSKHGDVSFDDFKGELAHAAREGRIRMARHDMPHALSPDELKTSRRSEVNPKGQPGVSWHFVALPRRYSVRERVARFIARVSRFEGVKAGSAEDCGHRTKGGHFAPKNTCAIGGGKGQEESHGRVVGLMEEQHERDSRRWDEEQEAEAKTSEERNWNASLAKRQALADKLAVGVPEEYKGILTPEDLASLKNPKTVAEMVRLARLAVANKAGYLPTKDELKVLVKMGQSARGQYEYGGKFLRSSFAADGDDGEKTARFWEAANSIFSSRTGWKIHSRTASMLTSLWIENGRPTGDTREGIAKIKELVEAVRTFEKPNGALAFPFDDVKAAKAVRLMRGADKLLDDKKFKAFIAPGMWGKTVNFGESWRDRLAVAIDSWMGAATTPKNIFKGDKTEQQLAELMDSAGSKNLKGAAKDANERLRNARAKVMSKPELYNSYKILVGKVAQELGMDPREVQETAWSALMGIGLLRAAGVKSDKLVENFTHELAKHSWDMEGVLNDQRFRQELLGDGLRGPDVDDLASWAGRVTAPRRAATGRVKLTPRERDIATGVARRVPAAENTTLVGRKVEIPGKRGKLETLKEWPEDAENPALNTPKVIAGNRHTRAANLVKTLNGQIDKAKDHLKDKPGSARWLRAIAKAEKKLPEAIEKARQTREILVEERRKEADAKKAARAANKAVEPKKKVRKRSARRPRRFASLGGAAALPAFMRDESTHQMAAAPPRFLSSEQVGYVIANQYYNKMRDRYTPEEAERNWAVSTLYKLMKIPSWIVSPYRPVSPGDPSYSTGPIVVDLKKQPLRKRLFGSFGQDIEIVCLDGKHRLREHVLEYGDSDMEAFVGIEAIPELRRYLDEFGPKRQRFVDSLSEYYSNPDPESWRRLIAIGRLVGLSGNHLMLISRNRERGWNFSPPLGEFVLAKEGD